METHSALTYHLADAIALYLIAVSVGGLVAPERRRGLMEEMATSVGLTFALGVIAYGFGAAILLVHWSFADPLATIVTLIGVVWVVQGLLLLVFPRILIGAARRILGAGRLWALAGLVAGIMLLIIGLTIKLTPLS